MRQGDHRLYGFLPETQKMDVAHWLSLAKAEAQRVQEQGKRPIFCGGTGFYLKALEEGLSPIPAVDRAVEKQAEARLADLGLAAFEAEVFDADPDLRGQFAARDRQRLLRAWSLWQGTGQGLSTWQARPKRGGLGALQNFTLLPDRQALYARIDQRFARMLHAGAAGEVRAVIDRARVQGRDPGSLPLAQALGFKELMAVERGACSDSVAQGEACKASRNYAKRQLTWGRNQRQSAIKLPYKPVNEQEIEKISDIIVAFMSQRT